MAACGVMMLTVFVSIASLRLKKIFPEQYAGAYFRVSPKWLIFFATISIISSMGLVALLFMESKTIMYIYAGFSLLIIAYYFLRKNWMQHKNIPMGNIFKLN